MGRVITALIIGILIGGALVYFTFVGVPHSQQRPGDLVKAPDASGVPPGTAQVVIRQEMLNALRRAAQDHRPPELLVENADFVKSYTVAYFDGVKYPHLERVDGRPDLLSEITRARTP